MLTKKELEELSYTKLVYQQFLVTCVSYKQIPYHAVIYDTDKRRQTISIYKKSATGFVSTKKLTVPRKDISQIQDMLLTDYPDIEIINI